MQFKHSAHPSIGPLSALALSTSLAAWAGCSASSASPTPSQSNAGGATENASGGAGAVPGTGGTGGTTFDFGEERSGTGGGTTGLPDGACGATTLVAEKAFETHTETRTETVTRVTPAALYIMQDQSGSMVPLWGFAVQALTDFVLDPASDGLHVAMQFFPFPIPFSDCTENTFAVPEVPWGILGPPGTHNQAITTALGNHAPFGIGTPIEDALRGVIKGCKDFEAANPAIECYGLLVTDGDPSDCALKGSGTYPAIAAQGAAEGAPVYTVGMPGADYAFLDTIAQAAGTDCNGSAAGLTCDASNGAEFLAALNSIRETVTDTITYEEDVEVEVTAPLDCEWLIPTGNDTDLDQVTVKFTDQATREETQLARVLDPADCPLAGVPAWHYDNEDEPTKLVACGGICETIKAADAKIDILVGCDVEIIIPR